METTIKNAKLEYSSNLPTIDISRQKGGLKIHTEQIQINIDTFNVRQTMGMKSNQTLIEEFSEKGKQASFQRVSAIVREGDSLANPKGMTVGQIAASKIKKSIQTYMDFIPKERPIITWEGGTQNIEFTKDELNFTANVSHGVEMEYYSGDVNTSISQKPRVDVQYLGNPRIITSNSNANNQNRKINARV